MFKYLLFRGLRDLQYVFSAGPTVSPEEIKPLLKDANHSVRDIWEDEEVCFQMRVAECAPVVYRVIGMNPFVKGQFEGVPAGLPEALNRAFCSIYKGENLLMVGRVNKRAYRIQERYARKVYDLLKERARFRSRAITLLGKAYGHGSIPLLCVASAAGLWQLCCTPFYKRILSLVSPPHPPSLTCG